MKASAQLFEIEDTVITRPMRQIAHPVVSATEDDLTAIAGVTIWGELLDRLGLVAESDPDFADALVS